MDIRWIIALLFVGNLASSRAMKLKDWLDGHKSGTETGIAAEQSPGSENSREGKRGKDTLRPDCFNTQQKFVDLTVGEASVTINTPTHDSDMAICYNGYKERHRLSCCTHTMERVYETTAVRDYHRVLHDSSLYLRNLMTDNAVHYQALFLQLLEGAHNRTERLFSDVYHLPLMERWGPTESLFLDLQAYLRQKNVSIHTSIETFFDELFPLVFHNNINDPRSSELNDEYRECLMEIRKDIYPPPFGGIPGKLAHQLSRSFASARAFLDALRMGIKVINTTSNMPLSGACAAALTRLEFCGHCDGHTDVPPCRGFCYNVMRGCFAHVMDINVHWNEMIDSLELLTVNMRGSNDLEEVLHSLHSKVSESIMHAMETAVKFNHKVVQRCGHPKSVIAIPDLEPVRPPSKPDASAIIPTPIDANTRLYAKIEMLMRNVIAAKGFLSHLPDTMCTEERFSGGLDEPCWNGESVDSYNKSIMTKDLAAQMQNPEVKVNDKPDPVFVELTKNIHTMKTLLRSKVNLDHMMGDAANVGQGDDPSVSYGAYGKPSDNSNYDADTYSYSSGDNWYKSDGYQNRDSYYGGYYGNAPMDDEDGWGVSGSGSGYGPGDTIRTSSRRPALGNKPGSTDPDITFEDPKKSQSPYITNTAQPGVGSPPGSTASTLTASITVVVMGTVCLWLANMV